MAVVKFDCKGFSQFEPNQVWFTRAGKSESQVKLNPKEFASHFPALPAEIDGGLIYSEIGTFLAVDKTRNIAVIPGGQYYTEGAMPFPDNLDAPARTMLTSEGGVSRTTHVIEDFKTKKPRLLTPVECERINGFPDNWTNTGMTQKKRNFMMGNALVVGVIEKIGIEIENIIDKEN